MPPKVEATSKFEKVDLGTTLVALAAVGAVVWGVSLAFPKTKQFVLGDRVTLSSVSFEYMGVAQTLYVGWGAKDGIGNFNNGDNLVGKLFAVGGPIVVRASNTWVKYSFIPKKDFDIQPILYLDPNYFEVLKDPITGRILAYETYKWLSRLQTPDEEGIIWLGRDQNAIKIIA